MLYDSVPEVLSELIRTAFIPKSGCKFIVADFSAIEARVIAIAEYDEQLVRRLIDKVIVYEDSFTVEFKSGVMVNVEA